MVDEDDGYEYLPEGFKLITINDRTVGEIIMISPTTDNPINRKKCVK